MPNNTSTVGMLLKEQVEPGLVNELNTELPLLESFEKDTGTAILGSYKVRGIQVNRNWGGYYTAEGGAPPVSGAVEIQKLMIPERFYHHALSFTEQILNASKGTDGAFEDVFTLGVADLHEVIKFKRGQSIWGDGRGVLALVNGAASSTTQTFDSPGGVAGADDGTRFLNKGQWVGFVNPAGSLRLTTAHQITNVPTSSTITITPTASTTDNDYLVSCVETSGTLTLGNTSFNHVPMGVNGLCDNGTNINLYFGTSRTTFPILNSTVIGTTALPVGAWSADVTQRAIDVSAKIAGARTNEIWIESGVKRAILRSLEADRRYIGSDLRSPNAGTDAAGAKRYADTGLKFGTIPIYQDPFCPYNTMYGFDTRSFRRCPGPMGWVDRQGTILNLSTTAVDTYDAYFRVFEQFYDERPNRQWKLVGISTDFVSAHVY